ncbi:hypothetical protein ScPMuIL_010760 [Solemya velum]
MALKYDMVSFKKGQPTLNVRSELAEPARETLSSRQDVGNNYETSEAGPSEGNKKDKWILIERKPVSFENDQFCWVHWCSCNAVTSRQVSLLDSYVNTSEEDFLEQYPDCLHLRASRKLFEKYDLDNSIVPTPDMNCRSGKLDNMMF